MLFQENPFYKIGAHSSDSQEEISSLAEDACLEADSDDEENQYHQIENILMNPRKRVDAELFWLCGISKETAYQAIAAVTSENFDNVLQNLSPWNQFIMHLNRIGSPAGSISIERIQKMNQIYASINTSDVKSAIDHDRKKAHMVLIQDELWITQGINHVLKEAIANIRKRFQKLGEKTASFFLLSVVEKLQSDISTDFIDELIQAYETDISKSLNNLKNNCHLANESIKQGNGSMGFIELQKNLSKWFHLISPLNVYQIKYFNRWDERISDMVAEIRGAAVICHNQYNDTETALKITDLLFKYFGTMPSIGDQLKKDSILLHQLLHTKGNAAKRNSLKYFLSEKIKKIFSYMVSAAKIFPLIILLICLIYVVKDRAFPNKTISSKPSVTQSADISKKSNASPTASAEQPPKIVYKKPAIRGIVFNRSEIRWAIRERIRLDTLKNMNLNDKGIDKYNQMVDEYNHCASEFKYRKGDYESAKADVEKERNKIVKDIQAEARSNGWIY